MTDYYPAHGYPFKRAESEYPFLNLSDKHAASWAQESHRVIGPHNWANFLLRIGMDRIDEEFDAGYFRDAFREDSLDLQVLFLASSRPDRQVDVLWGPMQWTIAQKVGAVTLKHGLIVVCGGRAGRPVQAISYERNDEDGYEPTGVCASRGDLTKLDVADPVTSEQQSALSAVAQTFRRLEEDTTRELVRGRLALQVSFATDLMQA